MNWGAYDVNHSKAPLPTDENLSKYII